MTVDNIHNAIIRDFIISRDDGAISIDLIIEYGDGFSQSFWCSHVLYDQRSDFDCTGYHLSRIMQTVDVCEFKELIGRYIRIKNDDNNERIVAIGHIIRNEWYNPKKDK